MALESLTFKEIKARPVICKLTRRAVARIGAMTHLPIILIDLLTEEASPQRPHQCQASTRNSAEQGIRQSETRFVFAKVMKGGRTPWTIWAGLNGLHVSDPSLRHQIAPMNATSAASNPPAAKFV